MRKKRQKKRQKLAILMLVVPAVSMYGGTGRPEDGFLFFVFVLGLLGLILGVIHLVDYIKIQVRRKFEAYFRFL